MCCGHMNLPTHDLSDHFSTVAGSHLLSYHPLLPVFLLIACRCRSSAGSHSCCLLILVSAGLYAEDCIQWLSYPASISYIFSTSASLVFTRLCGGGGGDIDVLLAAEH